MNDGGAGVIVPPPLLFVVGFLVAMLVDRWIPHLPASTLVTTGAYRISRNPMYGGLTLVYIGSALVLGKLWPLIALPVVLWTLIRMVVQREEGYLSETFGDAYERYRQRVRRWI